MLDSGMSNASLAREAGVDTGTVGDFLNGARWPYAPTLAKLDRALGFEIGTLEQMAEADAPPGGGETLPPLTGPPTVETARLAAERLRQQLDPRLRMLSDDDLVEELRTRMLLAGTLLFTHGEQTLVWHVADDGTDQLSSIPSSD
jgi:transcriptional regulator with XRE-family HTH domain